MNIKNKQVVVLGLRGSGKTYFSKWLIRKAVNKTIVFDTLNEYKNVPKIIRYIPAETHPNVLKFEFINLFDRTNKFKKFKVLVIDEANRLAPNREKPIPPISHIIDFGRHMGLTVVWIARRPTQLYTDIIELSDYIVLFRLRGKNDTKYLNDMVKGLGDDVAKLGKHSFIIVDKSRDYNIYAPI